MTTTEKTTWIYLGDWCTDRGISYNTGKRYVKEHIIPAAAARKHGTRTMVVKEIADACAESLDQDRRHDKRRAATITEDLPGDYATGRLQEFRAKNEQLKAALRAHELREKQGLVVDAEDVKFALDRIFTAAKVAFENIAPRVAPMCVGKKQLEIERLILLEAKQILTELADRLDEWSRTNLQGASGEAET